MIISQIIYLRSPQDRNKTERKKKREKGRKEKKKRENNTPETETEIKKKLIERLDLRQGGTLRRGSGSVFGICSKYQLPGTSVRLIIPVTRPRFPFRKSSRLNYNRIGGIEPRERA